MSFIQQVDNTQQKVNANDVGNNLVTRNLETTRESSLEACIPSEGINRLLVQGKKPKKTSTGKRRYHKKSKNGCDNCKRRRVKCDETKPACQKCINMKLDCLYTPVQPKVKKTKPATSSGKTTKSKNGKPITPSDSSYNSAINSTEPSREAIKVEDTAYLKQQMEKYRFGPNPMIRSNSSMLDSSHLPPPVVSNATSPAPVFPSTSKIPNGGVSAFTTQSSSSSSLPQQPQQQRQSVFFTQHALVPNYTGISSLPMAMSASGTVTFSSNKHNQPGIVSANALDMTSPASPPFQSTSMTITNSLGSLFSPMRIPLSKPLQQQSSVSTDNLMQINTNTKGPRNSIGYAASSIGYSGNVGSSLPTNLNMGMVSTAGVGGINYDFQELLGLKFHPQSHGTNASDAEEALASMQRQHLDQIKERMGGNKNADGSEPNKENNRDKKPDTDGAAPLSTTLPENTENNRILEGSVPPPPPPSSLTIRSTDDGDVVKNGGPSILSRNDNPRLQSPKRSGSTTPQTLKDSKPHRLVQISKQGNLNLIDLKLFHHYCTKVWSTITAAGISSTELWSRDIPELAFAYPFLMHSLLAFSATHLSRSEKGLEQYISTHRIDALRLLREAVLAITEDNTDALVASAIILIMDSLANASNTDTNSNSMSPSAWIFHVKGAATILTAVWPLSEKSRFYNLISMDLSDLGDVIHQESDTISELVCFDETIADLYPVEVTSPYLITLAYLNKLHHEKNRPDFILRIFAFPALLDKTFLTLLMTGDLGAMRIMRSYYKLLRGFTTEVKDEVWFLKGVSEVLPQDVDEYSGGGGMHMMLDFLGGGLPSMTTTNLSEFM